MYAWEIGLKTTYYLRSLGASQVEKSTVGTAGTHLRKDGERSVNQTNAFASQSPAPSPMSVHREPVVAAKEPIPSPIATPSPFTKEVREAVAAPKRQVKLHVAEDAICESCQ